MKTKISILIGVLFIAAMFVCTCSCGSKPSKAAEMNRIADSTYHADSIKLSK